MTRETAFIVQTFAAGRGMALKADRQVSCESADAARRMTDRLVATKLDVVAFSTSGDAELDEFDDQPVILLRGAAYPWRSTKPSEIGSSRAFDKPEKIGRVEHCGFIRQLLVEALAEPVAMVIGQSGLPVIPAYHRRQQPLPPSRNPY